MVREGFGQELEVRGKAKVKIHAMLARIVVQAQALATGQTALMRKVA